MFKTMGRYNRKMDIRNRNIAVFMTLCFFLIGILPVYADELSQKQRELQELNRQQSVQQSQLNSARSKERSLIGDIQTLEQNIFKTEGEIKALESKVEFLEDSIKKIQQEIEVLEEDLKEKADILGERLIFMYERGEISYLEVLLEASDIKDFLTRFDMLNIIVEQDMDLIEEIQTQRAVLNMKKSDLEVKKEELDQAKADQLKKKEILDGQKAEKQVMLSSVQEEKGEYQKAVDELESASREIEALIRKMQSGNSTAQGTGTYTWPTPGYNSITSAYGMRYHPILKTRKLHTGIDVGAPGGVNIVSVDSGNVIYSGWMGGYGQVVVVDHGGGVATLYAHMSQILASNGQNVSKGQTIGKVGSTGWSTGPHLHFEVRINGNPVDPRPYI